MSCSHASPPNTHPTPTHFPTDEQLIRQALEQAQRAANLGEVPVGCVIVDPQGQTLAADHNLRESTADPTAHAEVLALKHAAQQLGTWRLDGCTLAVTLEPCPMCAGALVNARIARLVYGTADPKMGCVHTLHQLCNDPRMNHRIDVTPNVLADDCAQILQRFFQARRGQQKPEKPKPPTSA